MKTGPAILLWKILYHQRWRTNLPFHSIKKLCVILRYSKSFKWMRSNQNTGKMYTIKSYKNFWKDFVVEQNLTHPKDDYWSLFNRPCKIVVVWDDWTTSNVESNSLQYIWKGAYIRGTFNQEYFSFGGGGESYKWQGL